MSLQKKAIAIAVAQCLVIGPVSSGTITVTTEVDTAGGALCSLRDAIKTANTNIRAGGCFPSGALSPVSEDTILIGPFFTGATRIELNGELDPIVQATKITSNISSNVTIDVNSQGRVLEVTDTNLSIEGLNLIGGSNGGLIISSSTVSLNNSTINSNSSNGSGGGIRIDNGNLTLTESSIVNNSSDISGGGIFAFGDVSIYINDSLLTDNRSVGDGGGISAYGYGFTHEIDVVNSQVSGNTAGENGGGINLYVVELTLSGARISQNYAGSVGGAIRSVRANVTVGESTVSENTAKASYGGAVSDFLSSVDITNSTFSGNTSQNYGSLTANASVFNITNSTIGFEKAPFAVYSLAYSSTINLINSIVAGSEGQDCGFSTMSGDSTVNVDSASIVQDGACDSSRSGDPGLLPLSGNGGLTLTHAIEENSIARNSGPSAACPAEDQRGVTRFVADGFCDVGAFEFNSDSAGFIIIPIKNKKAVVVPN